MSKFAVSWKMVIEKCHIKRGVDQIEINFSLKYVRLGISCILRNLGQRILYDRIVLGA
jgi:hypothetical protein